MLLSCRVQCTAPRARGEVPKVPRRANSRRPPRCDSLGSMSWGSRILLIVLGVVAFLIAWVVIELVLAAVFLLVKLVLAAVLAIVLMGLAWGFLRRRRAS